MNSDALKIKKKDAQVKAESDAAQANSNAHKIKTKVAQVKKPEIHAKDLDTNIIPIRFSSSKIHEEYLSRSPAFLLELSNSDTLKTKVNEKSFLETGTELKRLK